MKAESTTAQDFTCSITTGVSPIEVMDKIGRVSEWWAKHTEGPSKELNDVFTIRWGDTFVTFRISEETSGSRVVWHVTDCSLPWQEDKTEWTGTDVIFDLVPEGTHTRIDFMHRGLVPGIECYDNCVKGWTQYVPGSLLKFLNEGQGQPN